MTTNADDAESKKFTELARKLLRVPRKELEAAVQKAKRHKRRKKSS